MIKKEFSMSELDDFYIKGQISEAEYLHLASEDITILAIAEDKTNETATVSLMSNGGCYFGEVLYSELSKKDDKFLQKESSLNVACDKFIKKVVDLESSEKKSFEVTWYIKR